MLILSKDSSLHAYIIISLKVFKVSLLILFKAFAMILHNIIKKS